MCLPYMDNQIHTVDSGIFHCLDHEDANFVSMLDIYRPDTMRIAKH